jgi:hypothetical protein
MPNIRIKDLDTLDSLQGNEFFITDDTSVTKKITLSNVSTFINKLPIQTIYNTSYSLQLSNVNSYIRKHHNLNHTIVIPASSQVAFPVGSIIFIRNASTNNLTLSTDSGVMLTYAVDLSANILKQHSTAQIIYVGDNTWDII